MGGKKSTVVTRARLADSRYTPASSQVSLPTRTLALRGAGSLASTLRRSAGPSLHAQPPELTSAVRRMVWSAALARDAGTLFERDAAALFAREAGADFFEPRAAAGFLRAAVAVRAVALRDVRFAMSCPSLAAATGGGACERLPREW